MKSALIRPVLGAFTLAAAVLAAGCVSVSSLPQQPPSELATDSNRAAIRLELATAYFQRGENAIALQEVDKSIAYSSREPQAHNLRGLILAAMGRTAEASQAFERALALKPGAGDILNNYGWFLCQTGQREAAQQRFAQALSDPQYREPVRTWLASGECYARSQQWDAAQAALNRASLLQPDNPQVIYTQASVQLARGDAAQALAHVRQLNANPDWVNAQSLWLEIRILVRLGRRDEARRLGQTLNERFPGSVQASRYERNLFDE
ncbi:type IV pilus biogenesis/stability protein PilW [Amphibiibacter pelophylacis]|uniref:Type IV pilus biogenesis/stability protein PilW n=1 Tax=Amphibiibacter pelophylacis TaxID=1799477 RepID=A0ACC6NZ27_9BURK